MSKEVCRADWEEEEDFDVVKILNRNRKFQELRYIIALQICVGLFQFQINVTARYLFKILCMQMDLVLHMTF